MSDSLPEFEPETQAPMPAQKVKFCSQCGNPLPGEFSSCSFCIVHPPMSNNPAEHQQSHSVIRHVILFYSSMLATSLVFYIIGTVFDKNGTSFEFELFASIVFSVVIALFSLVHIKSLLIQLMRRFNPLWLLAPIPLAGVTTAAASLMIALFVKLGAQQVQYLDVFNGVENGMLWCVLLICVQPAIFEELAFRGVIHTSLSKILTPNETILVVGFMFAILHLSIISMPHLALVGLLLGWLRVKTGSLIPGMILHFLHNLFVIGLEKFGGS